ncbi:MAG: ATP-binding protein [Carbonactinosporaceae bacterium]
MTAAIVRWFPGEPAAVSQARAWLAALLRPLPVLDDAVIVVSELATNALTHTASGREGYTVGVCHAGPNRLRLLVSDVGAITPPRLRTPGADGECGRGLHIVAAIATCWGVVGGQTGRTVWAELEWRSYGSAERAR